MVMPIMLLEMVILAVAFYLIDRASRNQEIIDLDDSCLHITRSFHRGSGEWSFQPYWVQVILEKSRISWHPSRLLLRSHGKCVEVGTCLTDEERLELSDSLKDGLAGLQAQR